MTGAALGDGSAERPSGDELRAAIKIRDTWWPTLFSGRVANRIVGRLRRYPAIHPNHVTLCSMFVATLAAFAFYLGGYPSAVVGAVLVQLAFILDCVDGQLARYRGLASPFGAILDRVFDRIKPALYLLALAWGSFGGPRDESLWIAAFVGACGFFLVDFYRQQYLLLLSSAGAPPQVEERRRIALPLRALDLPFVRLSGGDHYFLISLLCFAGEIRSLLYFIATMATAQILLRPVYYVAAFRSRHGTWPWQMAAPGAPAGRRPLV